MNEVLKKAPLMWSTVINPRAYENLAQFQTAIKYHEDLLMKLGGDKPPPGGTGKFSRRWNNTDSYQVDVASSEKKDTNPFRNRDTRRIFKPRRNFERRQDNSKKPFKSRLYAVSIGSNSLPKPEYPRDDSTVSEGKTPADYGARGCIHCGSTRHWDRDCKHAGDNRRKVRAMFASFNSETLRAEAEYEDCYESRDNDIEEVEQADLNSGDGSDNDYKDLDSDEDF